MMRTIAHQLAKSIPELQNYYCNLDGSRIDKITQVQTAPLGIML